MEFPLLNDTKYPNINNVNVYGYQNDFDYTRWTPNTKLKLVNVRWNGDYNDVVKFDSNETRDQFFDELAETQGCAEILNTNVRMDKTTVKVPIPFDKAVMYNYLVVDIPIATSEDNPINYESADGFRRWHFFIQDWVNLAPSTTALTLALDVWTQYINSIGINYMLLERGHAPVAKSDVDSYLANPMDNSEYLLAKDVNFGDDTITRGGKFIPFGNGDKYICFASTCTSSQLSNLGTISTGQSGFTNPTFSNASDYPDNSNRWGYQYNVNNYSWGTDKSYKGTKTPAGNSVTTDGRIPNNTTVYAVPSSDASQFLNDLLNTQPTFLKTVLGCFMVDKSLVATKARYTIAGHTVYELQSMETALGSFKLSKDMFGYDKKYQRFAKLYTYPYAELEVTDNNGKVASVRIESTGDIRAQAITAIAFPYLNMRVFLTGISGIGSESYKWTDLFGTHDESISNSDWYKFCFDFNIPMYALYMDGQTSWNIQNYNRTITNGRNSALINYHNYVRQADNVYANSIAESNTAEINAHSSSNTQAANAKRSSSTSHTNTNNQANTLVSNNTNSCNANTDITANNNATLTANTERAIALDSSNNVIANYLLNNNNKYSNNLMISTTKVENETSISTTDNSSWSNGVASVASGAVTGGIAGSAVPAIGTATGVAIGAGVAAVGAIWNGVTSHNNATIITQCSADVASLTVAKNNNCNSSSLNANSTGLTVRSDANRDTNRNTVNNNANNAARQNSCATANTNNNASMLRTNATNLDNTIQTNASNTNSTENANATRTKNTTQNNSLYTRNAAVIAAQDILRNTQNETSALVSDSANMNPVQLCAASGDATSEYMRNRGIQIKVRTQSKSALRQAGDEFVRYGYALKQIWDVEETGLCLMKHFTYWKASDCWLYDKCETNDSAQNTISALFNRGVTVWSNPQEVGRVNPYDN